MPTREDIVRVARSYIGTPWHHMGRKPGIALDCAGVLICDGRELGIFAPDFDVPNYLPTPDGTMLDVVDEYMIRISRSALRPGDAVGVITDADPQHLGIVADGKYGRLSVIHASNDRAHPFVAERPLVFTRNFRFAAAWKFPGVE